MSFNVMITMRCGCDMLAGEAETPANSPTGGDRNGAGMGKQMRKTAQELMEAAALCASSSGRWRR